MSIEINSISHGIHDFNNWFQQGISLDENSYLTLQDEALHGYNRHELFLLKSKDNFLSEKCDWNRKLNWDIR